MNRLLLGIFGVLLMLIMAGCSGKYPPANDQELCAGMAFEEAKAIAQNSDCVAEGTLADKHWCNEGTGTWWIDLNLEKQGCNPACVIMVETKQAEINWMCTGAIEPEEGFEDGLEEGMPPENR